MNESTPPNPAVEAAEPPAAAAVANATVNENTAELEKKLAQERVIRKQREERINQLEDENRTLKTVMQPPTQSAQQKTVEAPLTVWDWE
jgi:hypothetical protein